MDETGGLVSNKYTKTGTSGTGLCIFVNLLIVLLFRDFDCRESGSTPE